MSILVKLLVRFDDYFNVLFNVTCFINLSTIFVSLTTFKMTYKKMNATNSSSNIVKVSVGVRYSVHYSVHENNDDSNRSLFTPSRSIPWNECWQNALHKYFFQISMNASLIHVMLRPHVKIFLEALHAHATSVFLEMGLIVLVSMNKRSFFCSWNKNFH
jgi:hypothetical protein